MGLDNKYDILIIGGGPIGLACGIEAKKAGLSYIILEKGCLVNSLYNYPANMTFFSTSDKLEIGDIPFVSNNIKPTRSEALEYYRRVTEHYNLNLRLFEEVKSVRKEGSTYHIESSKSQYAATNIIISTGFYDIPNLLNIPGEDLPKVKHYYKDPHFYAKQHVLVVGANNSSVDAALETFRKGAQVSMVIRESEIGQRVKYWVRPDIVNRIKEGSIKAYFNSNLAEVRENEVDILGPDGEITIKNDFVLAMTGYQPDLSFLRKLGIIISDDEEQVPEHNPETMETNQKGIYLAGVICGGMNTHVWFIENSRVHATRIVQKIVEN
ncbi:MAG: YpdA family putative bacillithiol disulfide reductase [Daejeonella sp.]|uniref:YpdA family putative bacillithiol disulfide reductase n=1 Tax=Daejeonella sp. TaxID=2805397 RepID=UPI00273303EB|nr:YpdA family putative bacillithiol disulfide reductase [Daejeonella sp.]MDP3468507.1 YpdA family putative bacillithiol disulfide reductase [Daejeonella sp.]